MIAESGRSFVRYYQKHYRGRIPAPTYALTVLMLKTAYAGRITWAALRGQ